MDLSSRQPNRGALPVSVVIPAFNAGEFIAAALTSVARQTRAPLEVIVVDDGSVDETRRIALDFAVHVHSKPNGGLSSARNAGVSIASGEWVAFLDADDRWDDDKLETFWGAHVLRPECSLLFSDYRSEQNGKIISASHFACSSHIRHLRRVSISSGVSFAAKEDLIKMLLLGNPLAPSTMMARHSLLMRHTFDEELRRDERVHESEDHEFYFRALADSGALILEKPMTTYWIRPSSLSSVPARCWRGHVALVDRFKSSPGRYAPGLTAVLSRAEPELYTRLGILHLRALEAAEARNLFGLSLSIRWSAKARLFHLLATVGAGRLGSRGLRSARTVWRRAIKRPIVALNRRFSAVIKQLTKRPFTPF